MDRHFSRIYLEITNCCNLQCSFCPGTRRAAGILSPADFRFLAEKLRPFTDYLYLHVMGEPLLHPQLGEILEICRDLGFRVMLTTNGTLIEKQAETLLAAPALHKVSFSLHSFEANASSDLRSYLSPCADFAEQAAGTVITAFRLWNLDGIGTKGLHEQNDAILDFLRTRFPEPWKQDARGVRLAPRIFLDYGERFDWPDLNAADTGETGTCRALRDQIAVLCDGTVVPCCLDNDGRLALGNLFTQELTEILASPQAEQMYQGFLNRKKLHPLCRRCGYSRRFDR